MSIPTGISVRAMDASSDVDWTLQALFKEAHSRGQSNGPVAFQGLEVRRIWFRETPEPTDVEITFRRSADPPPVQGLLLTLDKGMISVSGVDARRIVLWTDTSPRVVVARLDAPRGGTKLKVWNKWRTTSLKDGITQFSAEWTGNSGLVIDERPDGCLLRCTDGMRNPDFSRLEVELKFRPIPESERPPPRQRTARARRGPRHGAPR